VSGEFRERCSKIELVISDVDGVLTDGSVYLGEEGAEMKRFCIADGAGVAPGPHRRITNCFPFRASLTRYS